MEHRQIGNIDALNGAHQVRPHVNGKGRHVVKEAERLHRYQRIEFSTVYNTPCREYRWQRAESGNERHLLWIG